VFDRDLQLRFTRTVELRPMGHNISLCDVNGDGRCWRTATSATPRG
jgi:hypothetical protein